MLSSDQADLPLSWVPLAFFPSAFSPQISKFTICPSLPITRMLMHAFREMGHRPVTSELEIDSGRMLTSGGSQDFP